MNDANRGTGRTTKMIEAAKTVAASGQRLLIVGHDMRYARDLAAQVGSDVGFSSPENAAIHLRGSDRVVLIDHYAVDRWAAMLDEQRSAAKRAKAESAAAARMIADLQLELESAGRALSALRCQLWDALNPADDHPG
jgi:hypothetical protein